LNAGQGRRVGHVTRLSAGLSPCSRRPGKRIAPITLTLLGGDAGLRNGEIIALERTDLDFKRRLLKVQRSEWQGHVTAPEGG